MEVCPVEERNALLKKPVLTEKDLEVLFDCKRDMAYRYIEIINRWLTERGIEKPIDFGKRKVVRTIDYLDFVGLPRELML